MVRFLTVCLGVLLTSPFAPGSFSQAPAPAAPAVPVVPAAPSAPAQIDPNADAVLKKMAATFQQASSLGVQTQALLRMDSSKVSKMNETKTGLIAQRPNQARFDIIRGQIRIDHYASPQGVITYVPPLNAYLEVPAQPDWESLFTQHLGAAAAVVDDNRFGFFYMMNDPYAAIIGGASKVEYVGVEKVGTTDAHRVRFHKLPNDIDIWFETAERSLPLKMSIDTASIKARYALLVPDLEVEITLTFADWLLNEPAPAETFQFTPPADAEKKTSFQEMMRPKEPRDLIGKPAPEIQAGLHAGGTFNLAEHKDKNIVVLDFWSTSCPPCVYGLPLLQEVALEYKDKGVVLVAMNVGDQPQAVTSFLEAKKLQELVVGVDQTGRSAMAYHVSGIPQTVIIGRNGVVANVHVGLPPNIQDILRGELDALIAAGGSPSSAQAPQEAAAKPALATPPR